MKVKIKDNVFNCKVAVTPQAIQNGMMGKNFNGMYNGLLFMMPNRGEQTFWMYNCLVPLDIIMIDNNKITRIHHNCLPCYNENGCQEYTGFGDMVLEVSGEACRDLDIKEGEEVIFSS